MSIITGVNDDSDKSVKKSIDMTGIYGKLIFEKNYPNEW